MVVWIELNFAKFILCLNGHFRLDEYLLRPTIIHKMHQNSVNRINVFLKCCTFFNIANKELFYVQVNNYTIKAN